MIQQGGWVEQDVPLGIILKRRKRVDDILLAAPVPLHLVYHIIHVVSVIDNFSQDGRIGPMPNPQPGGPRFSVGVPFP